MLDQQFWCMQFVASVALFLEHRADVNIQNEDGAKIKEYIFNLIGMDILPSCPALGDIALI